MEGEEANLSRGDMDVEANGDMLIQLSFFFFDQNPT